jgi:hypothetical protein
MSDRKCSVPGCDGTAAVEVRIANRDGTMSERVDPTCPYLCAKNVLEEKGGTVDQFYRS